MSCCFQAPRQWCWCFRPPILRFLVIFLVSPHRPTQNQETYSTLNEQKGDDLSLIVSFWASLPHCSYVFLYTCLLFCFVLFFVGEINWNCSKTLYIRFVDSRARIKKMKSSMIYWRQGQLGGVRARYCAAVHSCAVKCSRETKGKTSVERLFNSRHQASFKMGLIASPCSWSWFKVLTSISWCPVCCRHMFQKGLSTAMESAVTLSTVREMMYFTKTKRSYLRFSPHPTPESPRQDRFKVLPITGPKWLDLFLWLPGG